jgi:hypothetical protein
MEKIFISKTKLFIKNRNIRKQSNTINQLTNAAGSSVNSSTRSRSTRNSGKDLNKRDANDSEDQQKKNKISEVKLSSSSFHVLIFN